MIVPRGVPNIISTLGIYDNPAALKTLNCTAKENIDSGGL